MAPRSYQIALAISLVIIIVLIALIAFVTGLLKSGSFAVDKATVVVSAPVTGPFAACSNDFLGADDFQGDWVPEQASFYLLGASSVFNGKILFANVDRKLVEDVLPVNWSLAPPKDSAELCHPILIMFGDQTNAHGTIGGAPLPIGGADAAYQEMMLLIPFTQRDKGGPLWHTAVIRMYLDDATATTLGNTYYAYQKQLATLTQSSSGIEVSIGGLLAFQATTSAPGTWENESVSTAKNLDDIEDILAMPLVGVVKNPLAVGGEYDLCSYFRMSYQLNATTESKVRSISTAHDYFIPFVPAMASWIGLPPLGNSTGGAIEIQDLVWDLQFPASTYCLYSAP